MSHFWKFKMAAAAMLDFQDYEFDTFSHDCSLVLELCTKFG